MRGKNIKELLKDEKIKDFLDKNSCKSINCNKNDTLKILSLYLVKLTFAKENYINVKKGYFEFKDIINEIGNISNEFQIIIDEINYNSITINNTTIKEYNPDINVVEYSIKENNNKFCLEIKK